MTILTIWAVRCANVEGVVEVRPGLTAHDHGIAADGLWRRAAPVVRAGGNGCAGRGDAIHRLDADTGYRWAGWAVDAGPCTDLGRRRRSQRPDDCLPLSGREAVARQYTDDPAPGGQPHLVGMPLPVPGLRP